MLANKRGRHPEFTAEDEELLQDLSRQAVRALRNARQHEAEKKVEELDALLAVSREITATLDLDKVMQNDRQRDRGDRDLRPVRDRDPRPREAEARRRLRRGEARPQETRSPKRTEDVLAVGLLRRSEPVGHAGRRRQDPRGPAGDGGEVPRPISRPAVLRSFHGAPAERRGGQARRALLSEQASRSPSTPGRSTSSRSSSTRRPSPSATPSSTSRCSSPGSWAVRGSKGAGSSRSPRKRRLAVGVGLAALLLLLFVVPFPLRVEGPARILPGRRGTVTAGVDGVVRSVYPPRGGPRRRPATSSPRSRPGVYQASLGGRAGGVPDRRERGRPFTGEAGDAAAMFEAQSAKRDELRARIAHRSRTVSRTPA